MAQANVVVNKFDKTTTTLNFTVKISKQFYLRVWTATQLIRLAAWIMGMASHIKIEGQE